MTARRLSLTLVLGVVLLLVVLAPHVLLLVFAGILIGAGLRGGGDFVARHLRVHPLVGLALFAAVVLALFAGFLVVAAPGLAAQSDELARQLPEAIRAIRDEIRAVDWMRSLVEDVELTQFVDQLGTGGGKAVAMLFGVFGTLANLVLMLFLGLYLAISPGIYRGGFLALLAPSLRPRVAEMMDEATKALRSWMAAQIGSMTAVGLLTWLGLTVLGVPLAGILGFISGLLAFIPNLGPILAAVPAVLLALTEGPVMALWVVGLLLLVQTVESYFLTPYLQLEAVALPPALTIAVQVLFGVLFGTMGLALATPLLAVALRLTRKFYVHGWLEKAEGVAR